MILAWARRAGCREILACAALAACTDRGAGGQGSFQVGAERDLLVTPGIVAFGLVPVGETAEAGVTLLHGGSSGRIQVDAIDLVSEGPDLTLEGPARGTLQAGETLAITVHYGPSDGLHDSGEVVVHTDLPTLPAVRVPIQTVAQTPFLVTDPPALHFGNLEVGAASIRSVQIANAGGAVAEVTSLAVQTGAGDAPFALVGMPVLPLALPPQQPLAEGFPCAVRATAHVLGEAHGELVVSYGSGGEAFQLVVPLDLFGSGAPPVVGPPDVPSPAPAALVVVPPDLVDFGYVAMGYGTSRTVELGNSGGSPLEIAAVEVLAGEGALPGELVLAGSPPGLLEPLAHATLKLGFENLGGASGTAWGTLRVTSDLGLREVTLRGSRAGEPSCDLELVPDLLDLGRVARGHVIERSFDLVHTGTAPCDFLGASLADCATLGGIFGAACAPPGGLPGPSASGTYALGATPIAAAGVLEPGLAYPIQVRFTPPSAEPFFGDDDTTYPALCAAWALAPQGAAAAIALPEKTGVGFAPNLWAQVGEAELFVDPEAHDFGLVTLGCSAEPAVIHAWVEGTASLDLTGWELAGCGPEMKVLSAPVLDVALGDGTYAKPLDPGESVDFTVTYLPQDEGTDACALELFLHHEPTPARSVALAGEGTHEAEVTDSFVPPAGGDVDVLFVVDSSNSMLEEQASLSVNFDAFVGKAQAWQSAYRIGVVTTDEDDLGHLQGTPRFVTPSDWSSFKASVMVGVDGAGWEQGLEMARQALSSPNTDEQGSACVGDAECAPPFGCYDGLCGGANRGFLRKQAALELVFVSDENDQSDDPPLDYLAFFEALKGGPQTDLVHVHAIVGPQGGCQSFSADAEPGTRYIQLAILTGGTLVSICESDFATGLAAIGAQAFGAQKVFFLTRQADPSTVVVSVGGQPCAPDGSWSYDPAANAVIFADTAACLPSQGATLEVAYQVLCLAP